jgi:uncharacterized surface protein with fasciclin (FAS1) repeats
MRKQNFFFTLAIFCSVAMFSCAESGTSNNTATDTTSTMNNTTTDAAADDRNATAGQGMMPSKTVVENAAASDQHTTLVAAVKAAGLDGTLSGAGPYTVFAPTNAAFEKLPAGTVDNLLKPENKDQLTKILTYHVVSGNVKAADLKDGQKIKTVQGEELTVRIDGSNVMINDAMVTNPNIESGNGVIHVVDGVLMTKN